MRRRRGPAGRRGERGQLLILFAGMFVMIAVAGVIAVDIGFWLSERRGIARASDLAALAASQDLPSSRAAARATALDFARRNGYEHGQQGVEIEITFFCGNSIPNPPPGICRNTAAPFLSICTVEVGCDALEVKIHKPGRSFFSSIFSIDHVNAGYASLANVKFNLKPIDVALLVDATSSMGINVSPQSQCYNGSTYNENKSGCPIKEARDAANRFTDILLDGTSNLTQVGYVPYRGCFNPPKSTWSGNNPCIRDSVVSGVANVTALTTDNNLLSTEINQTSANLSGSGTNTCWPLRRARTILSNSTNLGSAEQFVVLLADGNNVYNSEVFQSSPASPPSSPNSCRPSSATSDDSDLSADCNDTFTREASLDDLTWDRAKDLESDGVEIYVVGFNVCGTDQPCRGPETNMSQCPAVSPSTCESQIGLSGSSSSRHDNQADRRLLKCLASSQDGTNSHYWEVSSASQLPSIFQIVAFEIASRGLTEGP
jgi:hypothetical protein